jgi:prepilin-type N-terminal cleavage/methylation domain-containing protein
MIQQSLRDQKQSGFSMVELLITMGIFVLAIAAVSGVFIPLVSQFKQQSRAAETQIEGIVGLDILRRDINSAGFGLLWAFPSGVTITYQEAASAPANIYNDATTGIPRGILSGNNITATNILTGTDYLVIKATNIAPNDAAPKWTDVVLRSGGTKSVRLWGSSVEDLNTNDRVIVLNPHSRTLSTNGTNFTAQFNFANFPNAYLTTTDVTYLIYGIDTPSGANLRMPFNRADYFVSTLGVPARCAPNTGVLTKAIVSQADGTLTSGATPLLDCVADMQVDYWLDTDADGNINWPPSDDISGLTAQQIRDRLKEVRVYIVAHEGQQDPNFDFSQNNTREYLTATEALGASSRTLTFTNLKTRIGNPAYKQYRWKLYTIIAKPRNLKIEATQ